MGKITTAKNLLDMMISGAFDPRFAKAGSNKPSKQRLDAIRNLTWKEDASQAPIIPEARSIEEFAQRNKRVPIMSSIVDRTKTDSVIHEINGVPLSRPVVSQGGIDYMFKELIRGKDPVLFANQPAIANRHLQVAKAAEDKFGTPPIFAPHFMSPTGVDFSTATAETGMAHAFEVLRPQAKKELDKFIREKGFDVIKTRELPNGKKESYIKNYKIENWAGIDDPLSVRQLRNAPADVRKAIVNEFGTPKFFLDEGFLTPGEMRALVTKPELMNVRDGTFGNFGILNTAGDLTPTNHWSYATGIPGEGVSPIIEAGRIGPYSFADLQKAFAKDKDGNIPIDTLVNKEGIPRTIAMADPNNPHHTDLSALGKNISFGILDDKQLERMRALGMIGVPGLLAGTASANDSELKPKTNAGLLAQNYQGDLLGGMDFSRVKGDQRPFFPTVGEYGKSMVRGAATGSIDTFNALEDLGKKHGFIPDNSAYIPKEVSDRSGQTIRNYVPDYKAKYATDKEKSLFEMIGSFFGA